MGIHPNAKGALNVYQLNNGDLEVNKDYLNAVSQDANTLLVNQQNRP